MYDNYFDEPNETDVLNWDEGHGGRGIVDYHGFVHTWTDEEYELHHDYMEANGIPGAELLFYIEANGAVDAFWWGDRGRENWDRAVG